MKKRTLQSDLLLLLTALIWGFAFVAQRLGMEHLGPFLFNAIRFALGALTLAHAAILLSLESVFAVIGGWLILAEGLSLRSLFGCALMLLGMIVSQVGVRFRQSRGGAKDLLINQAP
ncbi:hypothetical protein DRI50_07280 [candidate division KSB1 bacterium]|nr:MAG: hypothetical protein DRI50_07280 [candidate division KSB1 bacterium]